MLLCGHLHENFNKKDKLNKTILINPGPNGEMITIQLNISILKYMTQE